MTNTQQTAATKAYNLLYERTAVFLANYNVNMTEAEKQQALMDRSEYFMTNVKLCEEHGLDDDLLQYLVVGDGLLADFMVKHFRWVWDNELGETVQKRI